MRSTKGLDRPKLRARGQRRTLAGLILVPILGLVAALPASREARGAEAAPSGPTMDAVLNRYVRLGLRQASSGASVDAITTMALRIAAP